MNGQNSRGDLTTSSSVDELIARYLESRAAAEREEEMPIPVRATDMSGHRWCVQCNLPFNPHNRDLFFCLDDAENAYLQHRTTLTALLNALQAELRDVDKNISDAQEFREENYVGRAHYIHVEEDAKKRDGHVYLIENLDRGLVKNGWSTRIDARFGQMQTATPDRLVLRFAFPGVLADEKALHKRFAHLNVGREWFTADAAIIALFSKKAAEGRTPSKDAA